MKRSNAVVRYFLGLTTVAGLATFAPSVFGSGQDAAPSRNERAAHAINIVDQNGRQDPGAEPSATSQTFDVSVGPGGSRVFNPSTVNISVGDTVRWTWASGNHSVTSGTSCTADSQFCSPNDMNCAAGPLSNTGAVYTHTFAQAGTYSYYCSQHCLSGMVGTVNVAAACTTPPPNMVAWYPGDNSGRDIAGGNNGSLQNGTTFAPGKVGQAFSFNGTSSYVEVPNSAPLNPTQQLTVDGWVFPTANAGGGDVVAMIINKQTGPVQYEIGRRNTNGCPSGGGIPTGDLAFFLGGVSGLPNDCGGWVDSGVQLPLNTWSHIALTYDGAAARAYVDGNLAREVAASGMLPVTNGTIRIGARPIVEGSFWSGLLDEIEIFDRALSQAEIQAIFNAGTAGKCKAPQPNAAFSRKVHGGAGTFDINLMPFSTAGVECRSGGASGIYQMIVQFANPVTVTSASLIGGSGSVSGFSTSGATVTVDLMNIANAQTIFMKLGGVSDGTLSGDVPVAMSVLIGDTSGNGAVTATDVTQTKLQSGQPLSGSNFREDVIVSGSVTGTDVSAVKLRTGTALP